MVNTWKILGNAIVAFCTAAIPVVVIGVAQDALMIGVGSAILTALLSAGVEIQKETEDPAQPSVVTDKLVLL